MRVRCVVDGEDGFVGDMERSYDIANDMAVLHFFTFSHVFTCFIIPVRWEVATEHFIETIT